MFFIGLTLNLILLITGIIMIIQSSYLIGGILIGASVILMVIFQYYYGKKKKKRKQKDSCSGLDCSGNPFDCGGMKKLDCDLPDCDCSPDCSF